MKFAAGVPLKEISKNLCIPSLEAFVDKEVAIASH